MKIVGGLIVAAYAAFAISGYQPFSDSEKGKLPPGSRRGPGGVLIWHSGFMGGK